MLARLGSCAISCRQLRYMRLAGKKLCEIMAKRRRAVLRFACLNSSGDQDAGLCCLCCLYASSLRAADWLIDWTLGHHAWAVRSKEEDAWTEIGGTHGFARNGAGP